jgi:hypothetical protein
MGAARGGGMDAFLDWAKSIAVGHRQAWIFSIVGAVGLLFLWFDWWPLVGSEIITAPIAGGLLLWGFAVLVVDAGEAIIQRLRSHLDSRRRTKSDALLQKAEIQRINAEAVENMKILNEVEARQLLWIFRNGAQRFSGYIGRSRLPDFAHSSRTQALGGGGLDRQ